VTASAGAPALEAYPVAMAVPGHTRNLFTGIALAFACLASRSWPVAARPPG